MYDTQTGLRAFSASLIPQLLEISGERYEYEMRVLLECARRGIPIREVAITTIYIDQNAASHFSTVKDSYRVYREILRFSAASLLSFLTDYGFYTIFSLLTTHFGVPGSIWISNLSARVISASVNYTLNRRMVFRSKTSLAKSILQYMILAGIIFVGNTLLLSFLVLFLDGIVILQKFVQSWCFSLSAGRYSAA
ncbi:MAG: GtrA family protein [Ruminococcus sp.]|nr:GtrA family protein [Ruminococcus sp.]